ncbi:hypothetical protein ACFL6X_01200 [Candidatus Latescibacterota bacterium]
MNEFTRGFRHDPMAWAHNSHSLESAAVRCHVLQQPGEGDVEQIRGAAADLLAKLRQKVDLHNPPARPHDLIHVACALGLDEGTDIGQVILRDPQRDDDGSIDAYCLIALCHAGLAREPEVRASIERWAEKVMAENPWHTCPWGAFLKMRILWLGRRVVDTAAALDHLISVFDGAANEIGSVADKDPWSFLDVAGLVDHPRMAGVVERFVPVILRAQKPDGGWGEDSFKVFRALHRHGLLEPLRALPPLPPDWQVLHSIPAPADDLHTMAWDGALAVTQNDPKRLSRIDPGSGAVLNSIDLDTPFEEFGGSASVGDKVWICDCFMPCVWESDPTTDGKLAYRLLAGPGPVGLCAQEDSVWHFDWILPLLIRSDAEGKLLDFGDVPFAEGVAGIAFDGEHLWALNSADRRVCMLEKTESGRRLGSQSQRPNQPVAHGG